MATATKCTGHRRGNGIGKHSGLPHARSYAVVLAGRRKDLLEATAAKAKPPFSLARSAHGRGDRSPSRPLCQDQGYFGRLDLLFNNAGIGAPPVPMEELPSRSGRRWWTPI